MEYGRLAAGYGFRGMDQDVFTTLVFKGGRFQGAAMPLEALPELAAYRELVLSVAKALWQKEHQERQRLPKGFDRSFRLVMLGVRTGSTVPVVAREFDGQVSLLARMPDLFDSAREMVERAIECGAAGRDLPDDFPPDAIPRFSAFGQTLAERDEFILVGAPRATTLHRYDRGVRKRILLSRQTTYEDAVSLVGEVRALDIDSEGFSVRTQDGQRVPVHAPPLFFPVALKSLTAKSAGGTALVHVRGTGIFDRDGALQRVVSASDVSLAEEGEDGVASVQSCPASIERQVQSLRGLGAGWFDDRSPPLSPDGLTWLNSLLVPLQSGFELPTPYLYPTPEGRVRAEWSAARWDVYAEFDVERQAVEAFASKADSDEVHERQMSFNVPGAETQLGRFLADHVK